MPNIAPAYVTVNPSYTLPELLLPYSQASGAFDLLPTGEPLVRLSEGDLVAYINRIDLRTNMASSQSSYNELPSVGVTLSQISTPSYLNRVRAEYDHHDTAAMGRRGVSIVEAQRLGMQQGHAQLQRNMLLQGMNPANGEGILNTNGATIVMLPADSNGNTTITTYDNGELVFFILGLIRAIKTRTNQLGLGTKFTILGPQQDLGVLEYDDIVQLTQFQREGAGSATTAGTIKDILKMNGDEITWVYDDTLIYKGLGGTDAILIVMPEVEKPDGGKINTNEFAALAPGLDACLLQLCDMAAPREIPTPLPGGVIDIVSELRSTSGWGVRPEAVTILSAAH